MNEDDLANELRALKETVAALERRQAMARAVAGQPTPMVQPDSQTLSQHPFTVDQPAVSAALSAVPGNNIPQSPLGFTGFTLEDYYRKYPVPDNSGCSYQISGGVANQQVIGISDFMQSSPAGPGGFAMDTLPHIEVVAPKLRQAIIEGRDVNFALLLVPDIDLGELKSLSMAVDSLTGLPIRIRKDARLQRVLDISEFVSAFGIYQSVMCGRYPQRRLELDNYLRIIMELKSHFANDVFYTYHKVYSAKAAAYLQQFNIKVDWGIKDRDLVLNVAAGSKTLVCDLCKQMGHTSKFCSLSSEKSFGTFGTNTFGSKPGFKANSPLTDARGRQRITYNGKELCNNFNEQSGCTRPTCKMSHSCWNCKLPHPAHSCRKSKQQNVNPPSLKVESTTKAAI